MDWHILPALNACLNSLASVFLVAGFVHIRRGNRETHRRFMLAATVTAALFLISYITYHAATGSTRFQSQGWIRTLYFTILISHTVLAAAIVPLVLTTLYRAWKGNFAGHRRIARWAWPLWMYVSVTGVAIYVLLYHVDPRLSGP